MAACEMQWLIVLINAIGIELISEKVLDVLNLCICKFLGALILAEGCIWDLVLWGELLPTQETHNSIIQLSHSVNYRFILHI